MSTSGSESGDADENNAKWIYFEVADTGVGIGHKGLKSLFKEFVQVTLMTPQILSNLYVNHLPSKLIAC